MRPIAEEEGHFHDLELRDPQRENAARGSHRHIDRAQARTFRQVAFAAELGVGEDLDLHLAAAVLLHLLGQHRGADVVLVDLGARVAELDGEGLGMR